MCVFRHCSSRRAESSHRTRAVMQIKIRRVCIFFWRTNNCSDRRKLVRTSLSAFAIITPRCGMVRPQKKKNQLCIYVQATAPRRAVSIIPLRRAHNCCLVCGVCMRFSHRRVVAAAYNENSNLKLIKSTTLEICILKQPRQQQQQHDNVNGRTRVTQPPYIIINNFYLFGCGPTAVPDIIVRHNKCIILSLLYAVWFVYI